MANPVDQARVRVPFATVGPRMQMLKHLSEIVTGKAGNRARRRAGVDTGRPGRADTLDRFFDRCDDEMRLRSFRDARVLLVAFPPEHLAGLRSDLRDLGLEVTAVAPTVAELQNVAGTGAAFTHILVNFDAFDDVDSGVDVLSAFRTVNRHVLVLFSACVAGDDLGSERSAICDATLRMPVSPAGLRDGLLAASTNRSERLGARRPQDTRPDAISDGVRPRVPLFSTAGAVKA